MQIIKSYSQKSKLFEYVEGRQLFLQSWFFFFLTAGIRKKYDGQCTIR